VGNVLRAQFQPVANEVTVLLPDTSRVSQPRLAGYARSLSELPQVIEVSAPGGEYEQGARLQGTGDTGLATPTAAYLLVYATGNPFGSAGQSVVSDVQHAPAPAPFLLTGTSPTDRDMLTAISDQLPEAVLIIGLSMFLVLFLFTGSVLLPIKAMILNTLSLTASFGALAWIFQDGHWASVFSNGAAQGFLIPQVLVLIFVISFGISMDYEVFLMSRIREEWLSGDGSAASNIRSVEAGLIKAGPIISRAALLMAVVFATMLTAELSVLKMLGLGLCLAVTMDATVVRGVAVPAFMCILGRANWWLPPWLRRLHASWGWSDESRAVPEAAKDLV
jgi:RND superfamily putative drug exporter